MINRDLDFPLLDVGKADLRLNIIFYESGQTFFSMTPQLSSEMGGVVIDPLVVVYTTATHHYSFLGAWFTTSFYFKSVSDNVMGEITSIADEFYLRDSVRGVSSLNEAIHGIVAMVTESIYRLTILMVIILLSNIVVTYNLVSNYFEQKKYTLFVKKTLGYSSINRNLNFLLILLTLNACVTLLLSFLISWHLLVIGIALLFFDLVVILLFERQLMKKSFNEIMKGER
jgi:putative ABC transport system permease protein